MDQFRRRLIAGLAMLLAAAAAPADTSPANRTKRVAVWEFEWAPGLPSDVRDHIRKDWASLLARHGFVDGKDIEITAHLSKWGDGSAQAEEVARRIVAARPALVVLRGVGQLRALQALTREIPLACYDCLDIDHLEEGGFESMRRPGGNVAAAAQPAYLVQAKRLEMLKEILPRALRTARALGIGVPASILVRAHRVIE